MGAHVSIAERAELDLAHQYRWYLDQASAEVAERFLQQFDQAIQRLARYPAIGRPRHFRAQELSNMHSLSLGGSFAPHLIFYRIISDEISIERVMHGARDLPQRLLEPPER